MIAQYLSRPGVSTYAHEWAEVVSITRTTEDRVKATWRKTNLPHLPTFTAKYTATDHLSVGELR